MPPAVTTADAVNYILNLQGSGTGITAYDNEIATAIPAEVLGKRHGDGKCLASAAWQQWCRYLGALLTLASMKRDENTVDAVNYILNLQSSSTGITAYADKIATVVPAEVLGERAAAWAVIRCDESTVDTVNYIVNLQGSGAGITAYNDEIKAALEKNTADILG